MTAFPAGPHEDPVQARKSPCADKGNPVNAYPFRPKNRIFVYP